MKTNLSGSYSDKEVTIIGNTPTTKLKTCYRCGETFSAETPYCEDCMAKINNAPKEKSKIKIRRFSLLDVFFGCNY